MLKFTAIADWGLEPMDTQERYLKRLLDSPDMLEHAGRHDARANDGMRRLIWAVLDSAQTGLLAVVSMAQDVFGNLSSHRYLAILSFAAMATILSAFLRLSILGSVFSNESNTSRLRRALLGTTMTFLTIVAFSSPWQQHPWPQMWRIALCGVVSIGISALLTVWLAHWSFKNRKGTSAVAVIGSDASCGRVVKDLEAGRWPGWEATLKLNGDRPEDVERLRAAVASGQIDVVIIATSGNTMQVRQIIGSLPDATARLCLAVDVPLARPFEYTIWLIDLWRNPHDGTAGAVKRVMDIVLSLTGLILLAPVLLTIALAIRITSPGPAIFRQWRFGACSRPFQVYKFRTMRFDVSDATGAARTQKFDPRVTRLGRILRRTSIDELPQLINVLRWEMSLVGPRAQALYMEVDGQFMFDALGDYPARHRVLPGITGWAQVNGSRGEVDTLEKAERRTQLDLWYIKNWSLLLDIKIIIKTVLYEFATFDAD